MSFESQLRGLQAIKEAIETLNEPMDIMAIIEEQSPTDSEERISEPLKKLCKFLENWPSEILGLRNKDGELPCELRRARDQIQQDIQKAETYLGRTKV